jgi:hypothetical protein
MVCDVFNAATALILLPLATVIPTPQDAKSPRVGRVSCFSLLFNNVVQMMARFLHVLTWRELVL